MAVRDNRTGETGNSAPVVGEVAASDLTSAHGDRDTPFHQWQEQNHPPTTMSIEQKHSDGTTEPMSSQRPIAETPTSTQSRRSPPSSTTMEPSTVVSVSRSSSSERCSTLQPKFNPETSPNQTVPGAEPPMAAVIQPREYGDAKDTLPIDRSVPFCTSLYPRDPDAYEPLDHYYQRQKETERHLLKEVDGRSAVRTAIEDGDLRDNGDGCGVFVLKHHGVEYYIVVGYHLKGYRIAVSGWPHLRSKTAALDSGYWTRSQVETIEAFNDEHFSRD